LGAPCQWTSAEALICRTIPEATEELILPRVLGPSVTEHIAGAAPARTYSNLLQDGSDDLLFEHYFTSDVAVVRANGEVETPEVTGIVPHMQVSPDGAYLLTTELVRPYSRIVSAERFPRRIRVWDRATGSIAVELELPEGGAWPTRGYPEGPREPAWDPTQPARLTWIEARTSPRQNRLVQWEAPFDSAPDAVAELATALEGYGWTSRGTLYVQQRANGGSAGTMAYRLRVGNDWADVSPPSPSSVVLRTNGDEGRVLEIERPRNDKALLFVAGPLEAETGRLRIRSTSGKSEFFPAQRPRDQRQRVIAALGTDADELLVSRETLSSPPNYHVLNHGRARALTSFASRYPQLRGVRRRPLRYRRSDGVSLNAMLYLPPDYEPGQRRATVFWIYPSEHENSSEVALKRSHEFWPISGPSRFSLLLRGYVLVDHPSMPIIGPRSERNDSYLAQLIASAEAVVEHVVQLGIAAPDRLAVAGRSYGAFSAANLLVHTELFRTAIAVSGAYNRTLTPFGFQTEQRSFWQAADLYARMSPFFHAHRFRRPILLVHGQQDENAGTPASQSARFFQALAGNGAPVRYVLMPFEGHQMRGQESNLHVVTEYIEWLGRQLGE
jgi:dipeptidyl aminopeptidase/acylaminoacyl peptidase